MSPAGEASMVEPQQDTALAADTPPLAAALLRLLRAMREAPDEVSLLARAGGRRGCRARLLSLRHGPSAPRSRQAAATSTSTATSVPSPGARRSHGLVSSFTASRER